ncbi:IclR family transcriptional regulator [Aromatoleum petrolei]|uniref:Helix-turn-helix domain-containing protein n=1 Tax=Aromatoleum petrolei TaxID=76116 RepID=A0ABX1MQY4_9RHOO|nr:IclR family transcriptional regulator [Aromatoleum petrolei]NMF89038.1 helix-turn-helix domain-containing protein [Aromatoleum petrolei]QTQ34398.1 Transcriptional regulator, IclR family [Aromatoleum petrolei]
MSDDNSLDHPGNKYSVPALERGLRLLGEFSRHDPVLSAAELARRLDLPRSTVFRMLTTLEDLGFVERAEGGRDFRLGIAVLRLGFEYLSSLELTELGMPILGRLRDEIGYASNLVVRDGRSIVYVAKVTPASWIASSVTVGTRLPAHATVFGRILLAELSLDDLRALYPEEHLERHSGQTPATAMDLFNLLQLDKGRDCIVGEGFFEPSISTVAAPVRDREGQVIAALGATVPFGQIEEGLRESLVTHIRAAALELSSALGYSQRRARTGKVISL